MNQKFLSIVIPAFNEEEHISRVLDQVLSSRPAILQNTQFDELEIVVVNDGSVDRTQEEIKKRANENVSVVRHEINLGYGAALKTGFETARGNYLAFMDADGTIDPMSFVDMANEMMAQDADMVVGKRFGTRESGMPKVRKLGNYFFAYLLSFLAGEKVEDTASGVRIFKKNVLHQLYPLPDGLHFTPAMSSKALHEKIKMCEVPVSYAQRSGQSKLNAVTDGLRFLRIILETVLIYNPFKVFLYLGTLSILFASLLMLQPVMVYLANQDVLFSDYIYRSIAALYFLVGGVQVILFGILARFLVSTFFQHYETSAWIHRINKHLKVYQYMNYYGFLVLGLGLMINGMYFGQYLLSKSFSFHWSWLMLGAALILIGVQTMISGLLIKMITQIKNVMTHRKRV
ncbi:MAG: glycosyltransferase family 2 protein [Bdellovibrionales bacterium]|nr:glycosyltransferase family 2 protein [Bdellovibrionales bacterium]